MASPVKVLPIPSEGRPPYYCGAVGPHEISISASPLEARVGDPITLNITVTGKGKLEALQAPPLGLLPEVTRSFQVSDDQLPGVVEGSRKKFTQSIRALTDEVTEFPRVPFAYFDTDRGEFVTVYSEAVPIRIEPAERMSAAQIVEAGDGPPRAVKSLTHLERGIEANYVDPTALLATQGFQMTRASAAVLAACPALFLACVLVQRGRRRLVSDTALARRRSARKTAARRIRSAAAATSPKEAAAQFSAALLGYVADRLNRPPAGMTRAEAVSAFRQAGTDSNSVRELETILQECELAQFGGGTADGVQAMAERVRRCVTSMESVKV
jgi:hypothetical protein